MKATTEMVLNDNLKTLNLSHMLHQLEPQLRQAREQSLDYGDFLLSLTEIEMEGRAENRLKRRLREAKFPLLKTLETFDYHAAPGLERRLLHQLASGEYINQKRNVIFLGKSGTGKTHLATGLGVEACRQGITTRFVTGCGLANELLEARQEHTLGRLIQRYARYGLLVLDELGYVPFSKEGAELLFQVLAERHERRSESYRLQESLQGKGICSGKRVKATQKTVRPTACGGSAPTPPEFIALETTGEAEKEG